MNERIVFHVDCNSFYASVELLRRPDLKDMPVAVAGSVDERHGIILAKNEAAKKFGVQTAETVWQAKRKCPNLVLLSPHHKEYRRYSHIVNNIYVSYTDRVEPFGIDESWLDMSGSWQLFGKTPQETADRLRTDIKTKTGLTVSIGISFNKVFSKMGSDYKKPDATTEITRETYQTILWPLPASSMLYVGAKVKQSLANLGIQTIGDLALADVDLLQYTLGKQGRMLWLYANGLDDSPVAYAGEQEPPKSIGNGLTFCRNLVGHRDIRMGIGTLADEVATRLRAHNLYAGSVQVMIKNPQLKSISRQKQLDFASNLAKDITTVAMELVCANWDLAKPIRMLTVTAQQLTDLPFAVQTSLLEGTTSIDPRREKLEKSIDKIRKKFGRTSILQAGILHNDIGVDRTASPREEEEQ